MSYLLDSNVLIDAKNRHYGFDIVPAFWDWLTARHEDGILFIVQAVYDELIGIGDELADWVKAQPPAFRIAPTSGDQAALSRVSQWAQAGNFTAAAVTQFLSGADYFLVAQGLALGHTVVTHERPEPAARRRIKIPDACNAIGVAWTDPFTMLRSEGARF